MLCLSHSRPIHGVIFLSKWIQEEERSENVRESERIFFAQQVDKNVCATQAILSVLLNCGHPDLELGETLSSFKKCVSRFDPSMTGLALSNSEAIKSIHNSFARQSMFEGAKTNEEEEEESFHFISYVPIDGQLFELDGLKRSPVNLGPLPCDGSDWIHLARPVIEGRMRKCSEGNVPFRLLSIVSDRRVLYQRRVRELKSQLERGSSVDRGTETGTETDSIHSQINHLNDLIQEEETKAQKKKIEAIRRRHNYLPLIMELLKILSSEGKLSQVVEMATERALAVTVKEKERPMSVQKMKEENMVAKTALEAEK